MPVLYEKADGVGRLTLSRPGARNAWGDDYTYGLRDRLAEIAEDDEVRCVVLTGDPEGGAFSAGANIKDPATHSVATVGDHIKGMTRYRRDTAFESLSRFPKPVIAAVNGYAVGIGCLVTFCCDLIVASEKAEWRLPQVGLGILPAYGGSTRAAQWIGRGLATRLALGFPLKAEEAYRIGLAGASHKKKPPFYFDCTNFVFYFVHITRAGHHYRRLRSLLRGVNYWADGVVRLPIFFVFQRPH